MARIETDEQCMERVRAGDLHGFGTLYDRHHRPVHLLAKTIAGDHVATPLTYQAFGWLLVKLLEGGCPGKPVRYYLYAALRDGYRQRLDRAVSTTCALRNWSPTLHHAVADHLTGEHLTVFPYDPPPARNREVIAPAAGPTCRSAEVIWQLATFADLTRVVPPEDLSWLRSLEIQVVEEGGRLLPERRRA
ncbi:hypothetical protein ABIE44_003430 [Marmoricola sp. OAE513]|uniref:hypothetical protein n=1 Tax=Marmoricola sp. OAE513 TaxID=2817894 RepID=UPI001AE7A911